MTGLCPLYPEKGEGAGRGPIDLRELYARENTKVRYKDSHHYNDKNSVWITECKSAKYEQ